VSDVTSILSAIEQGDAHAAEHLAIHEALNKLPAEDPEAAQLVQLRYFAGLSVEQAAEMIGLPRSTAYAHWSCAKASLRVLLGLDLDELPK
jgi:DNA-directed RNA polymerase specialized sigma24 family protein